MKILIVGQGALGTELAQRLGERYPDCEIRFFTEKNDYTLFGKMVEWADIVCITISTKDDGTAAFRYIMKSLLHHMMVVTSEKGAMSEFGDLLRPHRQWLGYNATCGGKSRMIGIINPARPIRRITGVMNGSCNNISDLMDKGQTLQEAVRQTQAARYTDPGANSLCEIIQGELADAGRKAVIVHNEAFPDRPVRFSMMSSMMYFDDGIHQLFAKSPTSGYVKRLIVHIFPQSDLRKYWLYVSDPCFSMRTETHYISGKFVDPEWMFPMVPWGTTNCLRVEYKDGKADFIYGPGAGLAETAEMMIYDIETKTGRNH